VPVQVARPVGDGSRVVDMLLTWAVGTMAVEVDGPSHFVEGATGAHMRLSTPTLMRNATLHNLWDITVAAIPITGWDGHFRSAAFRAHVAERLRAAGVPVDT